MYIETSSKNYGKNVFVSFERTDIIQLTHISFCYNRFSILTKDSLKSMGRFRVQLILEDNTWSTRHNIPKIDRYCDTSTQLTQSRLIFTEENYDLKLLFDEIDTVHTEMCITKFVITHSVY